MKNRGIALFLAACILISMVPTRVGAAEAASVAADSAFAYAGGCAYINFAANNFESIAALDLYIYYDAEAFSVQDTDNGEFFNQSQVSINTTEAGVIKFSAIDLDGVSGNGNLLSVCFAVNPDCVSGEYAIRVAIGDAYNADLETATVAAINGTLTVGESQQTNETFYIDMHSNLYEIQKDDTLNFTINNSWCHSFVAADFILEYDPDIFEVEAVCLSSDLTIEGAIYSVNTAASGVVRVSYACDTPVSAYELLTVQLKVIADQEGTTNIRAQAVNVYHEDLSPYLPYEISVDCALQKASDERNASDLFLTTETMEVGECATSVLMLEAGALVAAADFQLSYDPSILRCAEVKVAESASEIGAMVIINDNYTEGTIRFSYINMVGTCETDLPLIEIVWEVVQSPRNHYRVNISGTGVVDLQQNAVDLDMITDTGCIYASEITLPSCSAQGYTTHMCAGCGDSYVDDYTDIDTDAHFVLTDGRQWVDAVTTENDSTYPFELIDGVYASTNHNDSTTSEFTFTALYDCTLELFYRTSSEDNWDKLILLHNGMELDNVSGEVYWMDLSIDLVAGDIVKVLYQKDGSVFVGEDTAWFSFSWPQAEIGAMVLGPAEEAEPTCTEAVVCYYCQSVVKEALGHDWDDGVVIVEPSEDAAGQRRHTCNRCEDTKIEEFPLLEHTHCYESAVTDSTCTEGGYTTYICACGDSYVDDYIEPDGHSYGEWEETKAATYTEPGEERRDCVDCDHFETRELEMLTWDLMGDVNHDGGVDNLDATLVLQAAAGWSVELDWTVADVNADKNVDNLDATMILQYAAKWNVVFQKQ